MSLNPFAKRLRHAEAIYAKWLMLQIENGITLLHAESGQLPNFTSYIAEIAAADDIFPTTCAAQAEGSRSRHYFHSQYFEIGELQIIADRLAWDLPDDYLGGRGELSEQ